MGQQLIETAGSKVNKRFWFSSGFGKKKKEKKGQGQGQGHHTILDKS